MIELLKSHPFFKDKNIESLSLLQDQGYCNENYLLRTNESKYIVRKLIRDDIDREFEWHVLGLAYDRGITAQPILYDTDNGFMIFTFLEGEHKKSLSKEDIVLLAQTLKRLHSIKIGRHHIQIEIKQLSDEVVEAFEIIKMYPKEYVLCHNDLNPQNIFFSNEVKFIDFEYAGVNDRYFDLACACVEFKLCSVLQHDLLNLYFRNESYNLEKLGAYKVLYQALCDEWFEYNEDNEDIS